MGELKEDSNMWRKCCEEFEVDSRVDICNLIYKLKEENEKLNHALEYDPDTFCLKSDPIVIGLITDNKKLTEKIMAKDCEVSQLRTKVSELEYIILVAKKAKQPKM